MGQEVNISVTDVSLLNDRNLVKAEINFSNVWENVIKFLYIYVTVEVDIPVTEKGKPIILIYTLRQEIEVATISEDTKSVIINGEFLGDVDTTKEVVSSCNVRGYDKVSGEA